MKEEGKQCSSPEHEWCDPINEAGILYRTQYLVLSRTVMEAMPKEWQHRFVDIIGEIGKEFDFLHEDWVNPNYTVQCKDDSGKYMKDPWGGYRHPDKSFIEKFRKTNP